MTSFVLKLDPKRRAAGRLIGRVRDELVKAVLCARAETGLTRTALAAKLGLDKSRVSRMLTGHENITLRSVAELAWALDHDVEFVLRPQTKVHGAACEPARVAAGTWGSVRNDKAHAASIMTMAA